MASMRDIKRRKSSISSTQQITKAMKLVSTVKLQKAKGHAEQANPYFNYMYQTVTSMLAKSGSINHPYLTGKDSGQKAVIVITSNRGLAGGYNANVVKLITESDLPKDRLSIYAVGNKGRESLEHKGYSIVKELPELIETPAYDEASVLAKVEAVASENGARMQAMDSATSNAEDMISDLSLKYNRARQGSITQELTEIIAGASAIS